MIRRKEAEELDLLWQKGPGEESPSWEKRMRLIIIS